MEQPHLDLSSYSQQERAFIREASRWCQGLWSPLEADGVSIRQRPGRFGMISELYIDGEYWMGTSPQDLLDHRAVLAFEGDVLATGFGLGLVALYCSRNPKVNSLTIVESDERIVEHVWRKTLANTLGGYREDMLIAIVHHDANDVCAVIGDALRFDCAFLDHWRAGADPEVVRQYSEICDRVVVWDDEAQRCQ